ncbi:outer membrane protein assembly factor BamB family protein [Tuwongella immobilis]|uniref:EF-hand domain-containing protein n=1 Tax=Tuwongella immobilis TaxID=692036 RepID=A0A6C2YLB1_9BACT|nr:PQQ-binding-like beta-propeller repeat protein [Tuwongella immobilis]VIP01903.1 pyrrolo-quinoline quinone : Pyrrolo-quinoline quinone OS=Chthoniobacter flavus Ellin428 GN=CfE428DRAFT_1721 PE=4 SV=1: PQQ_2: EF-hand_5 [Tuwongella immobilis]VTR99797.1 pyrrolo-quinoline quinone : Pyrrolo-quinoline quinone OS=Chthoniobacter flavus Ellin428 GN=CfE428DRAFT_1721 PE=4 SV=1: PQQ_2: EF-hand_5 [Tuwongella immobilis]
MSISLRRALLALGLGSLSTLSALAGDWPQFRGPNGSATAPDAATLPQKISPTDNVIWQTRIPKGISSPIVVGKRIFLTADRDGKQFTLGLDRATGKVLWERLAPAAKLEKIHSIGSYAQATPAADSEIVVAFFGSSGLYAYDHDGTPLWHRPFGPFPNEFGAGTSPLIVEDRVILSQDHDNGSFLMALDKKTGRTIWTTDRSEFPRNYATPVIWNNAGKRQIVVVGTLRAIGYDFDTGREAWTVRGMSRIVNMSPLIGPDGTLFLPAWSPGGDAGERIDVPPVETMLQTRDANGNGALEESEVPNGPLKDRFTQLDRNKDGKISADEYSAMRKIFQDSKNRLVAVKPGGSGDITDSHVLWEQSKALPYVPSPVFAAGHLFFVKNGGLFTSINAKTGTIVKSERIFGSANYYASLVLGDGKIFALSERGHLSIIQASGDWDVLSQAKFPDDALATPAIVDGRIYLRTQSTLYCFGIAKENE